MRNSDIVARFMAADHAAKLAQRDKHARLVDMLTQPDADTAWQAIEIARVDGWAAAWQAWLVWHAWMTDLLPPPRLRLYLNDPKHRLGLRVEQFDKTLRLLAAMAERGTPGGLSHCYGHSLPLPPEPGVDPWPLATVCYTDSRGYKYPDETDVLLLEKRRMLICWTCEDYEVDEVISDRRRFYVDSYDPDKARAARLAWEHAVQPDDPKSMED